MSGEYDKRKYERGFLAHNVVLFQGAFSDNFFKLLLIFVIVAATGRGDDEGYVQYLSGLSQFLMAVPFILLPGLFGSLSDRFSKQKIIVATKVFELFVMTLGGILLYIASPTTAPLLWCVFFLMATQSAMFGPAKFGILPEALPEERLSWGNGIVQAMTMIAIIAASGLAGPCYEFFAKHGQSQAGNSIALVVLAGIGLTAALYTFKPPAADPNRRMTLNPYAGMGEYVKLLWRDKWLRLAIVGYVYFWFAAAMFNVNIIPYGKVTLGLSETNVSFLLAALSAGIAIGAAAAGFLSRGKIEVGLVPIGAVGMALFSGLLAWPWYNFQGALLMLFCLGLSAGLFDVPVVASIQWLSPKKHIGGIMAAANMLTWIGMASASLLYMGFAKLHISPFMVFLILSAMSIGMLAYIAIGHPVFILRSVLWIFSNTLYRMRVFGRKNIPEQGGALLVANHTSFLDALLILGALDRRVMFIMYEGLYDVGWVRPIAKMMGVIPVAAGGGPREVIQSLRKATDALKAGDVVCIFGEGHITRTGQQLPFRKGFERIMKGVDAPIIPVHIDQIWGSIFRFEEGKLHWRWPKQLPLPINIGFGAPLPSDCNAYQIRSAIQELGTQAYDVRTGKERLLHEQFFRYARRHPFAFNIADQRSGALNNLRTLAGTVILAKKLNALLDPDEKMVGLLLPQGVGGTLANAALQLMGRVPVNLNYTASAEALAASADQCEMKHIITAKAFLEQMPVKVPREAIYLEDVMASVEKRDRTVGLLQGLFMPLRLLEKQVGAPPKRSVDDLATIVFSSGSEGEAKGIMLSHYNITKNIEAAMQVFPHRKGDRVVGMLPFFHSFGFTATLWIVLTQHFGGIYHPNPMESRQIGELTKKYKGTILFSTSTFLHGFIRRCTPDQLESLRFIITGAEKLAPRVRDAFKEKFGVEPLEGYGTTECSPIVSLNTPDFRAPGFFQQGTKRGSIGHPLPGISVRIVDTDTREILQNGAAGLLMVKGPNIMRGYLKREDKTAEVLQDGWYETGDIANIDEDGFITITDRLARFSKIGGEMVSHTKIEQALHEVIAETELVLAIAGVPDENKGERLVVVHTLDDDAFDLLMSKLGDTGMPNLWIPKQKAFYKVDEIPVLGTGKMDIKGVKALARQLDIGE